jgi:hypothetical protein
MSERKLEPKDFLEAIRGIGTPVEVVEEKVNEPTAAEVPKYRSSWMSRLRIPNLEEGESMTSQELQSRLRAAVESLDSELEPTAHEIEKRIRNAVVDRAAADIPADQGNDNLPVFVPQVKKSPEQIFLESCAEQRAAGGENDQD